MGKWPSLRAAAADAGWVSRRNWRRKARLSPRGYRAVAGSMRTGIADSTGIALIGSTPAVVVVSRLVDAPSAR